MSPSTELVLDPTRAAGEQEFLDLVCRDENLLRAEFDAIIAAEWPGEPPGLVPRTPWRPPRGARRPVGSRVARPAARIWRRPERLRPGRRERSPP
jgi:hypothetical protein